MLYGLYDRTTNKYKKSNLAKTSQNCGSRKGSNSGSRMVVQENTHYAASLGETATKKEVKAFKNDKEKMAKGKITEGGANDWPSASIIHDRSEFLEQRP